MASQNAAPHAEYSRRLEARQELVAQLDRASERVSYVRIALAILSVAAIWLGNYWWLLPAVLFIVAVIYHSRVRQARASADRAAAHYRAGIARIEDRWSGQGNPGTRFDDPHHVYTADLDLFGPGNLFELLSIARTRMGENALASWLVAPAPVATVLERQQSVGELRERVDLREDLAVLGENAGVGVQPEELVRWAESPNQLRVGWVLPVALVLPLLLIATLVIWSTTGVAAPLIVVLGLEFGVVRLLRKQLRDLFGSTEQAFDNLKLLANLTERLEREPAEQTLSKRLLGQLSSEGIRASQAISRLGTVVQFIE